MPELQCHWCFVDARWQRPDPRQLKLNANASFYADSLSGVVGAVLRDYKGQLVAASCMFLPYVASASVAEATTMREGLSLANNKGCHNIVAEGDSLEVSDACNGNDTWWSESAAVFADCLDIATSIGKVIYRHCPREANSVAHDLARFVFIERSSCNWDDDPPSFLLNSLTNDVTII